MLVITSLRRRDWQDLLIERLGYSRCLVLEGLDLRDDCVDQVDQQEINKNIFVKKYSFHGASNYAACRIKIYIREDNI